MTSLIHTYGHSELSLAKVCVSIPQASLNFCTAWLMIDSQENSEASRLLNGYTWNHPGHHILCITASPSIAHM